MPSLPDRVLAQPKREEFSMTDAPLKVRSFACNPVGRLLVTIRRRIVQNAVARALPFVDDHVLHDVGLTRFGVDHNLPPFRPAVPEGPKGWAAKDELDLAQIRKAAGKL
jgi:hypothetical protein